MAMDQNTPPESDFAEMVESILDSVWSLEVLLLLHNQAQREWTTADLVTDLRSSELVVSQSIRSLVEAGLAVADNDGSIRYSPVSADLAAFVDRLEYEYRARPTSVRRLIVGRSNSKLQSFSDAFVLRKPPK